MRDVTRKWTTEMGSLRRLTHLIVIVTAVLAAVLVPFTEAVAQRFSKARIDELQVLQTELLLGALGKLEPSRPDRPELYAAVFASFASQDVFKRESSSVRELLDQRFGTRGRSIHLLNHRTTIDTQPFATIGNLALALQGIGERMDTEKDVLLLFITTHGLPGRLAIEYPGLGLRDLEPKVLLQLLDDAGIKHRVLVISACYSGSFLPTLTNPDTLVMTAARADRTSFGCSNEREWTYFGDALFNRALRSTFSFADAFQSAKVDVQEWEAAAKFVPSEPQIAIGARIAKTLAGLQRRIEAGQ
jgi:Peptidase C13 family